MSEKCKIHELMENPMSGSAIEERSFEIIDRELAGHDFPPDQWEVARRLAHTTADFNILADLRFSHDSMDSGIRALKRGAPIYTDSNMIRTGISLAKLRSVNPAYGEESLRCHVSDTDVVGLADTHGLPRSLYAVRKAKDILNGGIALFGNAPVALLEMNRMIKEEGVRPALVVGMPVGFVHVVESKEELMTLDAPYIVIAGRRGGSPLAVSVLHALGGLAVD
jgi:precorrin isomerase